MSIVGCDIYPKEWTSFKYAVNFAYIYIAQYKTAVYPVP